MGITRNLIDFFLSVSVGALSSVVGGILLVTIRVAVSPRRRRQFHRLMSAGSDSFVTAIRKLLNEAPEISDDTASRVSVRIS